MIVNVDQITEYFIYCKEVINIVANKRSMATDTFVSVITANDLSGISLTGDATFRKALSAGSKQSSELVRKHFGFFSSYLLLTALSHS